MTVEIDGRTFIKVGDKPYLYEEYIEQRDGSIYLVDLRYTVSSIEVAYKYFNKE